MERRAFIVMVGGSFLAAPLAGEAQQATRVYRVGFLLSFPFDRGVVGPLLEAFEQGLRDAGYAPGMNLTLELRRPLS